MALPSPLPGRRAAPPPPLASLEARADGFDLDHAVSRRPLLRLVPGAAPALAFMHLCPDAAMLEGLGTTPGGDLARHVADRVASRLVEALADPRRAPGLVKDGAGVLIDLPVRAIQAGLRAGASKRDAVAALPLHSAADPASFAALAGAARQRGWGVALRGLTAHVLGWVRPQVVAADWFIVPWSEALRSGAALEGLLRLDPDRVILTGCDTGAALDWGLGLGIGVFGGTPLDTALAGAPLDNAPVGAGGRA